MHTFAYMPGVIVVGHLLQVFTDPFLDLWVAISDDDGNV